MIFKWINNLRESFAEKKRKKELKEKEDNERIEKLLIDCFKLKMDVLTNLFENKNLLAKGTIEGMDGLKIEFYVEQKTWENAPLFDFHECEVSAKRKLKMKPAGPIPGGNLFFLVIRKKPKRDFYLFLKPILWIFLFGQQFFSVELNPLKMKGHMDHTTWLGIVSNLQRRGPQREYFWPIDNKINPSEFSAYLLLKELGASNEAIYNLATKDREKFLSGVLNDVKNL